MAALPFKRSLPLKPLTALKIRNGDVIDCNIRPDRSGCNTFDKAAKIYGANDVELKIEKEGEGFHYNIHSGSN